jgi:eukaryotic-like serine/threonine-protein kinase
VYLGRNVIVEKRVVAIKVLARRFHDRPDLRRRLEREAEIYDVLDHPNIVRIHDVGMLPDGTVYIVMDLIRGRTLREHLALGPLDLGGALHVMIEVTSAMCFAHRKDILHRDLKPDNIMVSGLDVKVLDFGIAKFTQGGTDSHDMPMMGTIGFLSPEQIANKHVDGRSDIYALGVIFYITLSGGRHPFENEDGDTTDSEMVARHLHAEPRPLPELSDCPEAAWRIVRKCLAKDPDDRYATMDELLEDLTELIHGSLPPENPVARRAIEEQEIARSSVVPALATAPTEPAQRKTEPLVSYTYASPAFDRSASPPPAPARFGKGHTQRIPAPPAGSPPMPAALPLVVQLHPAFAPAKVELTPSASEAASPAARASAPRPPMQHATSPSRPKSARISTRSIVVSGAFTGLILAAMVVTLPGFRAAVRPRPKVSLEVPAAATAPALDDAGPSEEPSPTTADGDAGEGTEGPDASSNASAATPAASPDAGAAPAPETALDAPAPPDAPAPSPTASPVVAPSATAAPAPARVAAQRPAVARTPAPRQPVVYKPTPHAPAPTPSATPPTPAEHRLFGSQD